MSPALLSFVVPGDPRGKGRPRASRQGGVFRLHTDDKTAAYENLVKLAARNALGSAEPLDGPLHASIGVFVTPPASASKKARAAMIAGELHPTKRPDLDNVVKAVLDGCNGVAFRDDALIVTLSASKAYANTAGVSVMIGRAA